MIIIRRKLDDTMQCSNIKRREASSERALPTTTAALMMLTPARTHFSTSKTYTDDSMQHCQITVTPSDENQLYGINTTIRWCAGVDDTTSSDGHDCPLFISLMTAPLPG